MEILRTSEIFKPCIFTTTIGKERKFSFSFLTKLLFQISKSLSLLLPDSVLGIAGYWLSPLPAVMVVQVRYPLSATINLANECTFAWTNLCHVIGGLGAITLI